MRTATLAALAALAVLTACVAPDAGPDPLPPGCVLAAHLDTDALVEVSGLARSGLRSDLLWMHDDGPEAALYAVTTDGRVRARLTVETAFVDPEDLAMAPCPDGSGAPCLWIADTGTNTGDRARVSVVVVAEPAVADGEDVAELTAAPLATYPLGYPDDVPDVEALAVRPDGTGFVLVEKTDTKKADVFAHPGPLRSGDPVVLENVATIETPRVGEEKRARMVTGADLDAAGRRLLVRVYSGTFELALGDGQTVADLGSITPLLRAAGPVAEEQGEAVAWDADGTGFWTVSEDPSGRGHQPLHHCQAR